VQTTSNALTPEQHTAAKIIGVLYLLLMATAMFAEYYAKGTLIVSGEAMQTARNILANETQFRLGIVSNIFTFAGDVVLAVAFYVLLKPINKNLALLAAFWRLAESAILAFNTLHSFTVLKILGATPYMAPFSDDQRAALARLFISVEGEGYMIGMVFLGLGSTLFACLLYQSRYIPRALSGLGIFASVVLTLGTLAMMIDPALDDILTPGFFAPIFLFEVGTGLWLLVWGIRVSNIAQYNE
jgi:Domain of unknown function (DUF4386)